VRLKIWAPKTLNGNFTMGPSLKPLSTHDKVTPLDVCQSPRNFENHVILWCVLFVLDAWYLSAYENFILNKNLSNGPAILWKVNLKISMLHTSWFYFCKVKIEKMLAKFEFIRFTTGILSKNVGLGVAKSRVLVYFRGQKVWLPII